MKLISLCFKLCGHPEQKIFFIIILHFVFPTCYSSFLLYSHVKCLFTSASQLGVFSTLNRTGNLNKAEEQKEGLYKRESQIVVLFGTVV